MKRLVLLSIAILTIAGCRDVSVVTEPGETPGIVPPTPTTPASPTASYPLFISGGMSPHGQSIRVSRGGIPVTDAIVTVNGFPIPYCCGDLYSGNLPETVRAGDTLKLKVVAGGVSLEAPGEVAPTPIITAPAAGSTIASTDPVRLTWSSPADPDRFEVCLNCWENSLDGATYTTSGSAREFEIAPGILADYGTGTIVAVTASKNDFLKATNSPAVTWSVRFVSSAEAIINVKY